MCVRNIDKENSLDLLDSSLFLSIRSLLAAIVAIAIRWQLIKKPLTFIKSKLWQQEARGKRVCNVQRATEVVASFNACVL